MGERLLGTSPLRGGRASIAIALVVLIVPAALATAVPVYGAGYRDFGYTGVSAPTADKPQSKLWVHDGRWWGSLFNQATARYEIHRLDWATQTWATTGTAIDTRKPSFADALADGNKLYFVSAGLTPTNATHQARVYRYTYNGSGYALDSGFPVTLATGGGMESVVIAKDTTGTLWVTFTRDSKVHLAHSGLTDTTWTTPAVLPFPEASAITPDDISSIVAYDGRVGVMWSDQSVDSAHRYLFASHADGAPDTEWTLATALQGRETADDHINLKSLTGDSSGLVFAATKTSLNGSSDILQQLLVLEPGGTWKRVTFGRVADGHTRSQLVIDSEHRRLYMFASSPCCSGGTVYYKSTSLDNLGFAPGVGLPLIQLATDTTINNPSTTKQSLSSATELLVIAGDDNTKTYVHGVIDLGPDSRAPNTFIDAGPEGSVSSTAATFRFSSDEVNTTFRCSLDGAAPASCASPKAYLDLAPGPHTFSVAARDAAGNVDPTPAVRTWTVDPSRLTFSADADSFVQEASTVNRGGLAFLRADGDPGMREEAYLRFTAAGFTGPPAAAHLRVFAAGGTTSVSGPAVYSAPSDWAEDTIIWPNRPARTTVSPDAKGAIADGTWLDFDVSTIVTGPGTYTFVIAMGGTDNVELNSRTAPSDVPVLVVDPDITLPETTLDSAPPPKTAGRTATFAFSSPETGVTFECGLDGGGFEACASPRTYEALTDGQHAFAVRARDAAGNVDPVPEAAAWTVDATAPAAPVIAQPADGSFDTDGTVKLAGTAEPNSVVELFDGAASRGTTGADPTGAWSRTLTNVADGAHAYTARATDDVGNVSAASQATRVTVDTVAPDTAIGGGPPALTSSRSAAFTFTSTEPGSTFECRLDGSAFGPCSSPKTYESLADGSHEFEVRARDAAGNPDPTPDAMTWLIDATGPGAPAIASPGDGSYDADGTVTLSGAAEPGSEVEIFDGAASRGTTRAGSAGAWSKTLTSVPDGDHAYAARARDGVGNVSDTSTVIVVRVDTVAPDTSVDAWRSGSGADPTADFAFSSGDPGARFECRLDDDAFAPCESPARYTDLGLGDHVFQVRARDAAGHADLTPAQQPFDITLAPPGPSPLPGAEPAAPTPAPQTAPAAAPPPAPAAAPAVTRSRARRLALRGEPVQRLGRSARVRLALGCDRACAARIHADVRAGGRRLAVLRRVLEMAGAGRLSFVLRLGPRQLARIRQALADGCRITVRLGAATSDGGPPAAVRRTIRLLR